MLHLGAGHLVSEELLVQLPAIQKRSKRYDSASDQLIPRSANTQSKEQVCFQLEPEDAVFDSRFLMAFPKTRKWDMILSNSPPEAWLSRIKEHTPQPFRSILASNQPPTIARLESLEWFDTTAAGVYGLVWKPKRKSVYLDSECYLYTSSASNYGRGLTDGRRNLLSTWPSTRNDAVTAEAAGGQQEGSQYVRVRGCLYA
jgi:hypothetical protein